MFVCRFHLESSYQHFINVYHCYVYMASSYQHIEGLYHCNILLLSTYWTCVTALIQLHKLIHSPTYLPLTLSPDTSDVFIGMCQWFSIQNPHYQFTSLNYESVGPCSETLHIYLSLNITS